MPVGLEIKRSLLDPMHSVLSLRWQCQLLSMNRSGLYYEPVEDDALTLTLMRLIDEQYTKTPFYGSRKILMFLSMVDPIVKTIF